MKKHEIIFSILKLPLDFIIVMVSFFIAREIRLITDLIPSINLPIQTVNTTPLLYYSIAWWILYIVLFITHWLYNSKVTQSKIKEFLDIIQYWFYWFLFFSVGVFFLKWFLINEENDIPRLIILFTFIISTFLIILERISLNSLQYFLISKWIVDRKKLLIINNKSSKNIKHIISDIQESKIYNIIWEMNKSLKKDKIKNNIWDISEYKKLLEQKHIDEILYIDSDYSKEELYEIWELSKIFGIRYRYLTNNFDITNSNTKLSLINKIPVIELENTALWIWWRTLKRMIDIIVSVFTLTILSPLLIIVAILVKYDDKKAPIIYKNRRVWQNWEEFNLYKFRYIKWKYCTKEAYNISKKEKEKALNYEKELIKKISTRKWPLYKIKDDPRKTKIWKIIEKYSIDELPQLFNVILWNMSLVWPRPHQPREVKHYALWEKRVLTIKPGITWVAQVNWRDKNWFEEEAKMDIFYIENWSLLLDIKIILKTLPLFIHRK